MSSRKDQKTTGNTKSKIRTVNRYIDDDGSRVTATDVGSIRENEFGKVKAFLDDIRGIAIGDITSVKLHRIEESTAAISHFIEFRNGGSCRLTYRKSGEVIEFRVGKVQVNVSDDKILTIIPHVGR